MGIWNWLTHRWFGGDDLHTPFSCGDLNGNGIPDCLESSSAIGCYDLNGNGICDFWECDNECLTHDHDWTGSSWND